MTDLQKRLVELQNRPTRYEAVVITTDNKTALLGYSPRHSKRGLADMLMLHGSCVLAFLGADETARFARKRGDEALTISDAAGNPRGVVRWSGRTQRDALCSRAEHPFVRTIAAAGGVQ